MPPSRQPGHATLADVAAAANVARSTASRALQGSPRISVGTTRRVRAAADRLGYQPNRIARSLRKRSGDLVGIVVPDIGAEFYSHVVKGAQNIFDKGGFQVLVLNTEREAAREHLAIQMLTEHRVAGVMLATSGDPELDIRVPVVFFDNVVPGAGVANVARANHDGMRLLVSHLVEHGHSRIAYIGGPATLTSGIERLEGYYRGLASHGLRERANYAQIADAGWSSATGGEAMRRLLHLRQPPTAVVTSSDTLALGALKAARDKGARVPRDLALVSFDDPPFGELLDPPVTALRRNDREMGELAASLLLHALENGATGPPTEVRLPAELVVRASCGCEQIP